MPRVFPAIAAATVSALLLAACSGGSSSGGAPTHSPSASKSASPKPSAHPTHAVATCPLTGLPAGKGRWPKRTTLAVKIDNVPDAQPQAGLDHADLVVQETVEGGLTRLFAAFQCEKAPVIGPIRSARTSDGDLVRLFHTAVFGYSGANAAAIRPWQNSAGAVLISWDATPGFFHLDTSRPAPHDVFASSSTLLHAGMHRDKHLKPPPPVFAYGSPSASGAKVKTASIHWPAASAEWIRSGNSWARTQDGRPDMLTDGKRVHATNVVIMAIHTVFTGLHDVLGNPSPDDVVTGTGEAWILRDGRVFHGTWTRWKASQGYKFKDGKGHPLPLRPGNTWLELLPSGQPSFTK